MRLSIFIDKEREEEVIIYAQEENEIVEEIRKLVSQNSNALFGSSGNETVRLSPFEIECFTVENNRVYAITASGKFRLKERLYQLEDFLPENFTKINQSCIANINKVIKFDASFSGTLIAEFKSGHRDYVSRRNIKKIKERLGL